MFTHGWCSYFVIIYQRRLGWGRSSKAALDSTSRHEYAGRSRIGCGGQYHLVGTEFQQRSIARSRGDRKVRSASQTAKWPVQAYQIKAAIRWLRAHAASYNFDPDKFIAWGMSAGGHLASIAGTSGGVKSLEDLSLGNSHYSSRVQAVVSWYSPSDFLRMGGWHDKADSPESELVGYPVQTCPQKVVRANPVTYITPDDPPFYIMHGTGDNSVPHSQSLILYEALQQAGVTATLISLPDYAHSDSRFNTGSRIAGVQEFLDTLFVQ